MAQIKGNFGPITIAEERVNPGAGKKISHRGPSDPLNFIKIVC